MRRDDLVALWILGGEGAGGSVCIDRQGVARVVWQSLARRGLVLENWTQSTLARRGRRFVKVRELTHYTLTAAGRLWIRQNLAEFTSTVQNEAALQSRGPFVGFRIVQVQGEFAERRVTKGAPVSGRR